MKNFVFNDSGVTVVEEPYIEFECEALKLIVIILLPLEDVA